MKVKKDNERNEIELKLFKVNLEVSFECRLQVVVSTNKQQKKSSFTDYNKLKRIGVFNEVLRIKNDPSKKEYLKFVILIYVQKKKKMVGEVDIDLNWDPVKNGGGNYYKLQKCPQKNVNLKVEYSFGNLKTTELDLHNKSNFFVIISRQISKLNNKFSID